MDLKISGKTALVLGGSKGIGRAISERLAREGCRVALVARGQAAIDEAVAAIQAEQGEAAGFSSDLTDIAAYDGLLASVRERIGAPEIVVYVPPTPGDGEVLRTSEEALASSYNVLVLCFLRLAKLTLPAMKEKGWGRFVTVGSASTKYPMVGQWGFHYAQANINRMAAVRLSKQIAYEVAAFGITLNTIGTGGFETETWRSFWGERARERGITLDELRVDYNKQQPLGRIGQPEELADLCAYLCSDLSGYTTAETIQCDGGKFIHPI